MKNKMKKTNLRRFQSKFSLLVFMVFVGIFTIYASANTFEVASGRDVPFTSVITTVQITDNHALDQRYKTDTTKQLNEGSFGIPQKIKFPESKQHIDIFKAKLQNNQWLASQGLAHTFLTQSERQKVFGQAVIYLRYNTPTTQYLGDVLAGDVVNIVTSKGWQLGYQVTDSAKDSYELPQNVKTDTSQIIVILINDEDHGIKSFQASLMKVGERI